VGEDFHRTVKYAVTTIN